MKSDTNEERPVRCEADKPLCTEHAWAVRATINELEAHCYVASAKFVEVRMHDLCAPCSDGYVPPDDDSTFSRHKMFLRSFPLALRLMLAQQHTAPPAFLQRLAGDENEHVRAHVAEHGSTPALALRHLADDAEWEVRRAVAGNPGTPAETLGYLARNAQQRRCQCRPHAYEIATLVCVARNYRTPSAVLGDLANDEARDVRVAVAGNTLVPPAALEKLADDAEWAVRYCVAQNTRTPTATLEKLAGDEDLDVRYAVAEHPFTPQATVWRLCNDASRYVCSSAKRRCKRIDERLHDRRHF